MNTHTHHVEINGTEYEIEVRYEFTPGEPARGMSGPPEDSSPATGDEVDVTKAMLVLRAVKWKIEIPVSLWPIFGIDTPEMREKIAEQEAEKAIEADELRVDEAIERDQERRHLARQDARRDR